MVVSGESNRASSNEQFGCISMLLLMRVLAYELSHEVGGQAAHRSCLKEAAGLSRMDELAAVCCISRITYLCLCFAYRVAA